ncbi:DNA-binding protein HGH1, putative [Trichophyton verrucosum HKI 0517]|uniref:Protein HGH1 homolog n=1 Tax=Trichophyton verrucosum (strain HKI 0517) TaxID=663202 RepID=D4D0C9_TRIVH|nr:DNA-binding protein HGH1, putative [Trichophyton verrucosum HKI 0517]EFE44692.1 DNA-binding protein HGH1, putative [Trichophyton verrucosum HKI 0517]
MPTELEEVTCENLVGYSASQPALFKRHQLLPVRDLKLLVKDYPPIAKDALTILINLSADDEVLKELAEDDAFLETLLKKVTNPKEKAATEITMLLANLAKSDSIKRIVSLERAVPEGVSTSKKAMDQLMDCFIKGGDKDKDQDKAYDYLSYLFADISKFEEGRAYFVTEQAYDAVNLLPYILLPLAGPEEFTDEESSDMLPDLQLLPPDKQRDPDPDILTAHLETLLLLTSTRDGRDMLRRVQVYPLIRECHLHTNNEAVQEACDRLVQVIMRDEEGEGEATEAAIEKARLEIEAKKADDADEEKVVDVF